MWKGSTVISPVYARLAVSQHIIMRPVTPGTKAKDKMEPTKVMCRSWCCSSDPRPARFLPPAHKMGVSAGAKEYAVARARAQEMAVLRVPRMRVPVPES